MPRPCTHINESCKKVDKSETWHQKRDNTRFIGRRYGRLIISEYKGKKGYETFFLCKCDCGKEKIVRKNDLMSGHTKSCGCLNRERIREKCVTHGLSNKRLYYIWKGMIHRCEDPKESGYHRYGGRGITVCDEWHDVKNFYDWAVKADYKEGLELERNDNNKGYSPGNCRWATRKEQTRNTRRNIKITYQGATKVLTDWAEHFGIPINTLQYRYYRGDRGERLFRTVQSECNWRLKKGLNTQ